VKIRITGTYDECETAADIIARVLNARYVGQPGWIDGDGDKAKFQVHIDARLREQPRQTRPGPEPRRPPPAGPPRPPGPGLGQQGD